MIPLLGVFRILAIVILGKLYYLLLSAVIRLWMVFFFSQLALTLDSLSTGDLPATRVAWRYDSRVLQHSRRLRKNPGGISLMPARLTVLSDGCNWLVAINRISLLRLVYSSRLNMCKSQELACFFQVIICTSKGFLGAQFCSLFSPSLLNSMSIPLFCCRSL